MDGWGSEQLLIAEWIVIGEQNCGKAIISADKTTKALEPRAGRYSKTVIHDSREYIERSR